MWEIVKLLFDTTCKFSTFSSHPILTAFSSQWSQWGQWATISGLGVPPEAMRYGGRYTFWELVRCPLWEEPGPWSRKHNSSRLSGSGVISFSCFKEGAEIGFFIVSMAPQRDYIEILLLEVPGGLTHVTDSPFISCGKSLERSVGSGYLLLKEKICAIKQNCFYYQQQKGTYIN